MFRYNSRHSSLRGKWSTWWLMLFFESFKGRYARAIRITWGFCGASSVLNSGLSEGDMVDDINPALPTTRNIP